jgi:propionyl-CoA synthetase
MKDEQKGQVPIGFIVLKNDCKTPNHEILKDCINIVRSKVGPVAFFKKAIVFCHF